MAKMVGNPTELLGTYKDSSLSYKVDKPGLFCVAVMNRFLPPSALLDGINWCRPGKSTDKNISSISCLIIWPNRSILHYLAGDARSDMEAGVIGWTGLQHAVTPTDLSNPPPPPIKETIPVIKASHHGTPSSFALNMSQMFKPSVILFSVGDNANNIHPGKSMVPLLSRKPISMLLYRLE